MEAARVEPEPNEKDHPRVEVALGLVAGVAGEDLVACAAVAPFGQRYEVIAGGRFRVRLPGPDDHFVGTVDTAPFEAGCEGFNLHGSSVRA